MGAYVLSNTTVDQFNSMKITDRNSYSNTKQSYGHEKDSLTEQEEQDYHTRKCPGDVEIPNRIFIKGFGHETTEEELKTFFQIHGVVHDAKIVRDRDGLSSKGYAFISFDSQGVAESVKKLGNVMYRDRNGQERDVVIGPAKIRKKRPGPHAIAYSPVPYQEQSYGYYWHQSPQSQQFSPPSPPPSYSASNSPTSVADNSSNVWYYQVPLMQTSPSLSGNYQQYQVATEPIQPHQQVVSGAPNWPQGSYQIVPVSPIQHHANSPTHYYHHQPAVRHILPATSQQVTHENMVTQAYPVQVQ
jgi:hypothetical protein